jgi:hypothetical protein
MWKGRLHGFGIRIVQRGRLAVRVSGEIAVIDGIAQSPKRQRGARKGQRVKTPRYLAHPPAQVAPGLHTTHLAMVNTSVSAHPLSSPPWLMARTTQAAPKLPICCQPCPIGLPACCDDWRYCLFVPTKKFHIQSPQSLHQLCSDRGVAVCVRPAPSSCTNHFLNGWTTHRRRRFLKLPLPTLPSTLKRLLLSS